MKVLIVLSFILAATLATPVEQVEIQVEKLEEIGAVANEPVGILGGDSNLANLVGASNVANLTAIIQQLVKDEIAKILMNLQAAKNLTFASLISSDEVEPAEQKPLEVDIKPEEDQPAEKPKPVFFLPRRPEYFAPPHPFFYGQQQPIPYYNSQPYQFYPRGEDRYGSPGGPQWRRINPTNDDSLTDLEALAELELLLNEKDGPIGDVEGRGLMSSISTTTNSAKSSFKSFINSLSSALPSFSIVRKTYLVPGLAING